MLTAAAAITGSSAVNDTSSTCDDFSGVTVNAACTARQRRIARRIQPRSGQDTAPVRAATRTARWHRRQRAARSQRRRPQRPLNSGLREQIEPIGDLLDDGHAAQHLGLARHHGVGDRIDPQDALQFAHLVLAGVVEQRAGCGVARRELRDRDQGQQRAQQHRRQQAPACAAAGWRGSPHRSAPPASSRSPRPRPADDLPRLRWRRGSLPVGRASPVLARVVRPDVLAGHVVRLRTCNPRALIPG